MMNLEEAKIFLDEWKFRQSHCWKSVQTFVLAAVTVSIAPYLVDKGKLAGLGRMILLFPIIGGVIALVAVWLYAAEYTRCQAVHRAYRSALGTRWNAGKIPRIFGLPIGWVTVWSLGIGSIILAILNFCAARVFFGI
jgi:hypothetical protein